MIETATRTVDSRIDENGVHRAVLAPKKQKAQSHELG
jgi:hypothetical protein